MIKNDFVIELDLELDPARFMETLEIIKNIKDSPTRKNLKAHQFLVNDFPYLKNLHVQFPFLASIFNIYYDTPGRHIPLHIDAGRKCAINIPIMGTENTWTVFYKLINSDSDLPYNDGLVVYDVSENQAEEVFRFTLARPTLVNTGSAPHKVENNSAVNRIIISWSVLPEFTFQDVKQLLGY
jgi:hypothetical protein